MNLIVNGKKEEFPVVQLGELLRRLEIGSDQTGIAVAVNEEVVFRTVWSETRLKENDRVEIIKAMQGG